MRLAFLLVSLCLTVTLTSARWGHIWHKVLHGVRIAGKVAGILGDTDMKDLVSAMKDMDNEEYKKFMDSLKVELEQKYDASTAEEALQELDDAVNQDLLLDVAFPDAKRFE